MQRTNTAAASSTLIPVRSTTRRVVGSLSPRSTPGGFRLAATVVTAVCAVCALVASSAIAARGGSLDAAATAAEQLVDVQEVRTAAVEADSIAASSFLASGEAASERRAAYETRLGDATRLITTVAQRAPTGDLEALGTVSDTLVRYAGLVEQARANNRQGFPVGAAYQRQASALLRTDVLPAIQVVDADSRGRLNGSLEDSTRNGAIALVALAVAVVALLAASWLLWRRTHRVVNVPIAVGGGLVVAALVWSFFVVVETGSTVSDTVDTTLRASDSLSRARASAFDARSAESLTLINRGNGAANEEDWKLASARAIAALNDACNSTGSCFIDDWSVYEAAHREVRDLDVSGRYDDAVALATGNGLAATTFAGVATTIGDEQVARAGDVADGFADAEGPLGPVRWFALAAGLLAAALVVVGFGQRLREYR